MGWRLAYSAGFVIAAVAMPGLSAVSSAQAPVVYGDGTTAAEAVTVISDPHAIAACLCATAALSSSKNAMSVASGQYSAAKNHAVATKAQVERLRLQIDPNQSETLDAYRRLVTESERANATLYQQAQPAYAASVARYNQAVATYNADCAGQRFDPNAQATVAAALICPVP